MTGGTTAATRARVAIPEAEIALAYKKALRYARRKADGVANLQEPFIDAATSAILWTLENCHDPATFGAQCWAAVALWTARQRQREARRWACKGSRVASTDTPDNIVDTSRASGPLLIGDLPDDLAFAVRLYMIDGFNLRDCGLLLGCSAHAVQDMLTKAAKLLAPGTTMPVRRLGEKRLRPTEFGSK